MDAVPKVRIQFPPAESQTNFRSLGDGDGESIAEGRPTGCSVGFSPGSLTAPIAARCREHRLHAAEAHQCHAAERGARWRPGELALYEVQFGADRRKVLPPLIGRPKRQTVLRIVGEGQARRADRD